MAKASKRATAVAAAPETTRYEELKRMLEERKRELTDEVQGRIRGVRADGAEKPHDVMDQGETSEVDIQEDIELALIQMKAETLNKINEALQRLEPAGTAAASSAVRKSPERVCGRCRSRCAARTAKKRARTPPIASACCSSAAVLRASFTTCRDNPGVQRSGSADVGA